MRLEKLIQTILSSSREDWHTINCWAPGSGPSYHEVLQTDDAPEGGFTQVGHNIVAIYKDDIAITLAFGMMINADFVQDWANIFVNPHASSHRVDVFYNNALVFRESYVSVDGGKGKLPFPRGRKELLVPKGYFYFIKLLDCLSGYHSRYEDYFQRSDLRLTDTVWPEI